MANLQFSDLQTLVYSHCGLDSADTTNQTNVKVWLNFVQQDICARWPWSFLYAREAVATIPDYTTGTVDIANGATSVTGHSTVFTTTQGDATYFIQFAGTNDFYNVASRSSNTSIALANPFQGTSLTGVTYILRKFFYSLSTNCDEVLDVRNWNTPVKLMACDFRTVDLINPLVQSTSPAYGYMMFGTDTSGNLIFMPYPFPNDARLFEFRTRKRPTDMVNASDVPSIPNKYSHLIAFGAIAAGFAYKNQFDQSEAWNAKFEKRLGDMKKEYRASGDYQPILGSVDSISRTRWVQMPTSYPIINS